MASSRLCKQTAATSSGFYTRRATITTEYELYYDEMMEGPVRAHLVKVYGDATADFEVLDDEHKQKYWNHQGMMIVHHARLMEEGGKRARRDEYVYKIAKESAVMGTSDNEKTLTELHNKVGEVPEPPSPPGYTRERVDQIMDKVKFAAVTGSASNLAKEDLLVLHDMLYEMDRHLPDFFES